MLAGKTQILIHVEGHDIREGNLSRLVHADKLLINTDRGRACRKAEDKGPVFLVVIDPGGNIISCPFAHLIIIVLNDYSHY